MAISYGKMVIIGAGKVGSAILNSVLRMNILDEIVVVNRNQKKALGEVLEYHQYCHRAAKSQVEYLRQSLDLLVQDSPLGLPEELLQGRREALEDCTARLAQGLRGRLLGEQKRLAVLSGTLDALSPLRVLSRGYAMVTKEGRVLKSAGEAAPGDKVAIRLAEGELSAEILEKGE